MPVTYKDSGVDLDVYEESMARLPSLAHRTFSPRVQKLDGGFAGLFQLDFNNALFKRNYQDPVLVSCTDGVGTKIEVAKKCGKLNTLGIDLVAMSVNDAICCGAEPLFFLDYLVMGRDDPDLVEQLVEGISAGCVMSDSALLGGETAIHPGQFEDGDFDMAGFCVGVVERKQLIDGSAIADGDIAIGVASSGLHSNGFSLARKIVFEIGGHDVDDHIDALGTSVGEAMLEPTRIYTKPIRQVLNHYKVKQVIHGIAHITGGGLQENVERIMPAGLNIQIEPNSWDIPPVFAWLQQLGEVEPAEMARVFNMGLGLVLLVSPFYASSVQKMLEDQGLKTWQIGKVVQASA